LSRSVMRRASDEAAGYGAPLAHCRPFMLPFFASARRGYPSHLMTKVYRNLATSMSCHETATLLRIIATSQSFARGKLPDKRKANGLCGTLQFPHEEERNRPHPWLVGKLDARRASWDCTVLAWRRNRRED